MTSKKLLAGVGASALLFGAMISLNNCTITTVDCTKTPNEPICQKSDTGTSDTGTSDAQTGDSGGNDSGAMCSAIKPNGPLFFDDPNGNSKCDKCMVANCCSQAQACASDNSDAASDTCMNYLDCLDQCGNDNTCIQACNSSYPNGKKKYDPMDTCLTQKCGVSCGVGDAGM